MVSGRTAAAVGIGAGVLGVGGYLAYKYLSKGLSPSIDFLVNGSMSPTLSTLSYTIEVTGGTPNGPAQLVFSLQNDPKTGGQCAPSSQCPQSFDSKGNIDATYTLQNPPGVFYGWIFDPTAGVYSNAVVFTVASSPSGGAVTCQGNQVPCQRNGVTIACCPPGEQCANADGSCPYNTAADPSNPGCCRSVAAVVGPDYYNAPSSVNIDDNVCQPCELGGACGNPNVQHNATSFVVQVIGTDGNPMTGYSVQAAISQQSGGTFALDKSTYVTDSQGKIYPKVSAVTGPPTANCGGSGGFTSVGGCTITFQVVGFTAYQGWPVQVVAATYNASYTTCGGLFGSCGSCSSATSCG